MQALGQRSWLMSPRCCRWQVGYSVWFPLCTFSGTQGALWCLAAVIWSPTDSFGSISWQPPPLFVSSKHSMRCGSLWIAPLMSGWDPIGDSHCSRWGWEFGVPEAAPEQRCGQRPAKVREPGERGTGGPFVRGGSAGRREEQELRQERLERSCSQEQVWDCLLLGTWPGPALLQPSLACWALTGRETDGSQQREAVWEPGNSSSIQQKSRRCFMVATVGWLSYETHQSPLRRDSIKQMDVSHLHISLRSCPTSSKVWSLTESLWGFFSCCVSAVAPEMLAVCLSMGKHSPCGLPRIRGTNGGCSGSCLP